MQPLQRSEYCLSNNIQEVYSNFKMHRKNSINPVQILNVESIVFLFFLSLLNNKV